MTSRLLTLSLAISFTSFAAAQTTTHRPVTHHATAAKAAPKPAPKPLANPADNPPGVPSIEGTPKPLYSLRYVDTLIGTGPLAEPRKYYTVRYTGWLTDGTKFDSSYDHPGAQPITFPYGAHQVIPGWDTGFEGMHVGGKRRIYIPYQLAYGESGRPPVIPAKADLIFDIELVSMSDTPPQPPVQPRPATPPPTSATPEPKPSTGEEPATQPATPPPADSQPKSPPHPEGL